jgi:predicted nucleic acid-binding protein
VIVISDTNILSSLAAAETVALLFQLFPKAQILIPPAVEQELQAGLQRKQAHLASVFQALTAGHLSVQPLSAKESALAQSLPRKLNTGECEAIALAQSRQAPLLSNDKRAIRYCQQNGIEALDLATLLNLLWVRRIVSKKEVEAMLQKMAVTEGLTLNQTQRQRVFAPRRRRRRKP